MKTITNLKWMLFIAVVAFLSSCNNKTIKGSGNVVSETRNVSGFKKVDVESALTVIYTESPDYRVEVIADDNLIKYITTVLQGDELRIGIQGNHSFKNVTKAEIHISAPSIDRIEASGASTFKGANTLHGDLTIRLSGASSVNLSLEASSLTGDLSGASSARINGSAGSSTLEASGASMYNMEEFSTSTLSANFSGASSATIQVTTTITASLSGASSINYYGNPNVIALNMSGASSINKKN